MRATTGRLLARVSQRYPCVVISGRALADIEQRVQEIPLWYVFGNHGFEPASRGRAADRSHRANGCEHCASSCPPNQAS